MEFGFFKTIFIFLSSLEAVSSIKNRFPLLQCTDDETDLLLVIDTAMPSGCVGPPQIKTFFLETVNMFLSTTDPESAMLRVSLISDTPVGLITIMQFQDNTNSQEIRDNISNLTACNGSESIQSISESNIFNKISVIGNTFTENQGSRSDANHVTIMLISRHTLGAVDDIKSLDDQQLPDVKLLVILINLDEIHSTVGLPSIVSVPGFSSLSNNQLISMALCKKCKPGWFQFENNDPFYHLSCYTLDTAPAISNDWYHALSKCEKAGSTLVSIETQEELNFLERHLYEILVNHEFNVSRWEIFIGLRKYHDVLPRRFRWKNSRPLIVSHWQEEDPYGVYSQECGIWKFPMPELQMETVVNFEQYLMKYKNGWSDVGCGVPRSNMTLCEVTLENLTDDDERSLEVIPARRESIKNALSRGEFVEDGGKIMSIAANSENPEFYDKFYKHNNDGFKLFDCQEDEGKGRSIAYSYVCDNIHHCSNKRDEELCLYRQCNRREFQCRSLQCVPLEARCDVYADCYDRSDETDCVECKQRRCCDGTCVPIYWFNEDIDCKMCIGSDDFNKTKVDNSNERCCFICNRTSCVNPSQFGDGVTDCTGPEGPLDETVGQLEQVYSCAFDEDVLAWAPRCVYIKDRYGTVLGCRDMSHLWNCDNFSCPEGYAKCPNSYCIPLHLILDGNIDCPLGEDEQYMKDHNCTGNFACWNSDICLHPDLVCDKNPDCPFRDDEQNCDVTCQIGFRCIAGTVTVANYDIRIPLQSLSFIDEVTRYLDLSGIDVTPAFSKHEERHLSNLVIIILSKCKIQTVEKTFVNDVTQLQSLYSLDISYNMIAKVPTNSIFRFMTNLHILNLSHNRPLVALEDSAFLAYYGKSMLQQLDLSYTSISRFHSNVLQNLVSLKVLDLSHTLISELSGETFPPDFKLEILYLRSTSVLVFNVNSFNGLTVEDHLYTENYELCCPQIRGPTITEQVCNAPSDAISTCCDLVGLTIQRVLLWLVGFIAVLGNMTVIACRLTWNKSEITKTYGIFVTNLGISDLIMGIYLLMIASADSYYRGIYIQNSIDWKHGAVCHIAGFLSTLSSETSAFFILLITIDRYLVLKFPFGQYSFSKRMTFISCVMAWSSGFSLALTPSLPTFNDWTIYYANGMCLGLPLTTERLGGWQYSVAIFVGLNTIMFVIIAAGQFSIYRAMSGNRASKSTIHNSNRRAQDIAVAKQLSLVVLTDFLCYFPVGLMGLLAITGHEIGKDAYAWSAVLVLPINSAINPVLYTVPFIQSKLEYFRRRFCRCMSLDDSVLNSLSLATLSKAVDFNFKQRTN